MPSQKLSTNSDNFSISPIAFIKTPFDQKFAIPRQSHALSIAKGEIEFVSTIDPKAACEGLEQFSHLWLSFVFHHNMRDQQRMKVRPPRLGGNKTIGVFASRSSFRPNNLGLSVVKNLGLYENKLCVSGVDLLNNTPIIDIKPYLPYADIVENASAGYAEQAPKAHLEVAFDDICRHKLNDLMSKHPNLEALVINVLSSDPRPAYKQQIVDDKVYRMSLYQIDIGWKVEGNTALVVDLQAL